MANIQITQRRSDIGCPPAQRRTLRALGLGKIGRTVVRPDTADVRGMVERVKHLVDIEQEARSES